MELEEQAGGLGGRVSHSLPSLVQALGEPVLAAGVDSTRRPLGSEEHKAGGNAIHSFSDSTSDAMGISTGKNRDIVAEHA